MLWLWRRPAATASIRPLAWERPYATAAALKKRKERKGKERKGKEGKENNMKVHYRKTQQTTAGRRQVNEMI